MEKLETIADVRKELDWMKRKKELDTTGFFYNRSDITREGLIEKYGEDLVESIDESHCENWLEVVNDFDQKTTT